MLESGGIQVRPYATGDEPGLLSLFTTVFGRTSTLEQWRWKLHWPHCGVDNVWLARAGGRAIFQYAAIPTRFSLDHRPATMMVSVDTMTAPEFRRRGLLTQVAAQAYAQWRSYGLTFVIGLPNEQWRSRTEALGGAGLGTTRAAPRGPRRRTGADSRPSSRRRSHRLRRRRHAAH